MPLYDQYAPYRQPLTESENAFLHNATPNMLPFIDPNAAWIQDFHDFDNFQNFMMPNAVWNRQPNSQLPLVNAYMQIAYGRAAFDLQHIDMPTDPKLDQRFPGVDPKGKYCHVDMDFAQRITRLKNAAELCEGANKELLDDFLNGYNAGLGHLESTVTTACRRIQVAEHAAKVCPDRTTSGSLENAANDMAQNDPDIQKMNRIITAMEQVAGLRSGVLDPQTIQDYNDLNPGVEMNGAMATGVRVPRTAPETFAVNFQNFDNIARQNYFTNPKNWGYIYDHKIPKEPTDSLALAASMRRYVGGTTSDALDSLFSATEQTSTMSPQGANRATLVIVDGKTVSERIQEEYNKLGEKPPFSTWYAENAKRMSGEIVAAGLMAGKRVEAFIPDHNGKLPEQPTVLHKTGYEPTPDKPVTLNAWERFFNKLGFYKEKAAQAKEHQELLDARERLKANYKVAQNERMSPTGVIVKDMFFGDYMRQHNIPNMEEMNKMQASGSAYQFDRSHATSACICMMAAMGHDIRDILDPNKLQEEKKAAAESYMVHAAMNRKLERLTDPNAHLTQPERDQLKDELMTAIGDDVDRKIEQIRSKRPREQGDMTDEQWQQKNRELLLQEHEVNTKFLRDCTNLEQILNEAQNTPNYRFDPTDPRIPTSLRQGDSQWLGSVFFHGQRALQSQIDNIMTHTNLNDPAQRDSILPVLNCAATAVFDGSQTCSDRDVEVMHGYLRAAQQTAVNHYPTQNGVITAADTANITTATNNLAEETMETANRIGFFFRSLSLADKARVGLTAPLPETSSADLYVTNLMMEQVMMKTVSGSNADHFSDKLPPYTSAGLTQTLFVQEEVCKSLAKRFGRQNNNWASDAKLLISGEVMNSIDIDLTNTIPMQFTDPRGRLRAMVNANQQVTTRAVKEDVAEQVETPIPQVFMTQAMGKKLGIRVPQDRQIVPQAGRSMGR